MKKVIYFLLAFVMLLSFSAVVFASESSKNDGFREAGTVYVGVETRSADSANIPLGARSATAKDIAESNALPNKPVVSEFIVTPRASWTYLSGYFVYNQTTSYNCGPAAVQAALRYLNGSAPTQDTIAVGCKTTSTAGTYISDMVTYINSMQSKNRYTFKYQANSTNMSSYLYSGIVSYGAPPIIGMAFSSSNGWLYSSGGHFMSVYGAKSDKSEFALADPWIGYSNSGLAGNGWSYSKSATDIFKAYNSVNIGLMY